MDGLELLVEATFASSAALLLVLALRRPLRAAFGARVAYGAWALLPAVVVAVALPAAAPEPGTDPVILISRALPVLAAQPIADGMDPRLLVAACWLAGVIACTAWMSFRQCHFRRSLGRLSPPVDGVRESEREVDGLPATLGLWSPQVIVPPAFAARYEAAQRELMLAHERAHVARGDLHANAIAATLRCLFWFNPLVHVAAPRFRQDQELACDATVLAKHPGARRSYGEALLHAQLGNQGTPLGCHFGFGHPLRERIAMLKERQPSTCRRAFGAAFVSLTAIGFAFAAWATQPAQEPVPAASQQGISGVSLPPPKYPAYAAEHNLSGRVVLLVDVAADGTVANATVERSEPKGVFDAVALEAVKGWKFNPAMKDGKAIAAQVRVPVDFSPDPKEGEEAAPMKVGPDQVAEPADYDWIKQDPAKTGELRETLCDVVKLDAQIGVSYCGIRKK